MRLRHRGRLLSIQQDEIDPTAGMANLLDVMLVFCCGLIVALVLSWNLQSVIFAKATPEERARLMEAIRRAVVLEQGKELNDVPPVEGQGGSGYQQVGMVFRDPKTGKLILIEE